MSDEEKLTTAGINGVVTVKAFQLTLLYRDGQVEWKTIERSSSMSDALFNGLCAATAREANATITDVREIG
jgi:hypothetical protein